MIRCTLIALAMQGVLTGCSDSRHREGRSAKTPVPEPTRDISIVPIATPSPTATLPPEGGQLSRIRIQEKGFNLVTENYDLAIETEAHFAHGTQLSHRQDYQIEGVIPNEEAP